jgi:uncharacterized protein (DUF1684 family)
MLNRTTLIAVLLTLFTLGCSSGPAPDAGWIAEIQENRRLKDRMFRDGRQSPLPDSLRARFTGLDYYPVDPTYRLRVKIDKYDRPERIEIVTSLGLKRAALRYGQFRFKLAGKTNRLQVYKLLDVQKKHPELLFVPFLDATSGSETYPGGRYIDLKETADGVYTLDFNLAYNPYCAYNRSYDCPIPPEENRLSIPIRAGEKAFSLLKKPL